MAIRKQQESVTDRLFNGIRFMKNVRWPVLGAALVMLGASCFGPDLPPPTPTTMSIWLTEEDAGGLDQALATYTAAYPHVSFKVETFAPETYEQELFSAWARGVGPDIFAVDNSRVGQFREFATPMPERVTLTAANEVKKLFKTELQVEPRTHVMPTIAQLEDYFVQTVASDVTAAGEVYGLPLYMDTLGMYYNRDLLARSQIAVPPTTWEEFRDAVQAMVGLDELRNVVQPAAALGTAANVPYYFDLLSVLMMQNGTEMAGTGGEVRFAEKVNATFPGIQALDFYTAFSNPTKKTYTWNNDQLQAIEAFTQGTLGFTFGYFSDAALIRERAPQLNFSYAKIPQVDTGFPVNMARYPVLMVHTNSENSDHAWNFLRFLTLTEEQQAAYGKATGRVPALKALIAEAQSDPVRGVFAQQALTAESWYHGVDPDAADRAFREMVDEANDRKSTLESIIDLAAAKVRVTMFNTSL